MKTPPVQVGQIVETTIDRLTLGGAGLSRVEGFVVFIPFTVPGDTVQIEIREIKKGFANATLKKVVIASTSRVEAPCSYFGKCGGCDWQNISYDKQLEIKSDLVKDVLKKFHLETTELLPTLASPKPYRYRNRIQLHKNGTQLGFREARSHSIISVNDCLTAEDEIAAEIKSLASKNFGNVARIDIRRTATGSISVKDTNNEESELGFAQVNTAQNKQLIETLISWLPTTQVDILLDLYSGSGNITLPLHKALKPYDTIAVEMNVAAIEEGRRLAQGTLGIEFVESSVDKFISKYKKPQKNSLAVVLDPPRAGAGQEVMKQLAYLAPQFLMYISCDPMTWARDVDVFMKITNGKYRLQKVQGLDMFPQTSHIEIISMITPA